MPPLACCQDQAPWIGNPWGAVTWWDVEKFSADAYVGMMRAFQLMADRYTEPRTFGGDAMFTKREYYLPADERQRLADNFGNLAAYCERIELPVSAENARMMQQILSGGAGEITNKKVSWEIGRSLDTLMNEMKTRLFLYVPVGRSKWYLNPRDGWDDVIRRFPAAIWDVEEASRCLACDRCAGAVFHAMQIAEVGAVEVGKIIAVRDPKPGWPSTIGRMRHIVLRAKHEDLNPEEQRHRNLLGQLLPIMESMEQGWRHKISHVENKLILMTGEFQPEVAKEIVESTRAFMRRLATDLPSAPQG